MIRQVWENVCVLNTQKSYSDLEVSIRKPCYFHNFNSVIFVWLIYIEFRRGKKWSYSALHYLNVYFLPNLNTGQICQRYVNFILKLMESHRMILSRELEYSVLYSRTVNLTKEHRQN